MGLQPGLSRRGDVEKTLGTAVQSLTATLFEYSLPNGGGKIYVEYRPESFIIDRIERRFSKPVSRAALIRSLQLPENGEEKGNNKEGQLVEYFGEVKTLAFTYASGEAGSGVVSIGYYSMELFERMLDRARNPQMQFDPAACRDLYFWAQTERDVAKKSKDVGRHQAILEISILAQRGECDKARSQADNYKKRYH
jgi:hypothetical protein